MSGYTIKITAKLPVANTDPQAMAKASELLTRELGVLLNAAGLRDLTIEPTYRPNLKVDAVF